MERVLVTGGAGFIGSHLVDRLVEDHDVVVLDDLSGGNLSNIQKHIDKKRITFIHGSITSEDDVRKALEGVTMVFHFAAQPDVRLSTAEPMTDFNVNMKGGMVLLEGLRKYDVNKIVFASSGGTVYGDSKTFPTREDKPLAPISNYGAAKCAFEMYLSSYSELYGINAISLRLANIIGPRLKHGVIFDLYNKINRNPSHLEVLGTGMQEKAYMEVSDTIEAISLLTPLIKTGFLPINLSSGESLTVSRIAQILCEELSFPLTKIKFTGTERGWAGDVLVTDLDISRLKSFGWKPKKSIEESVRNYIRWIVKFN